MMRSHGTTRLLDATILAVTGTALLAAAWYSEHMMTRTNGVVAELDPPAIEWRDQFLGVASPDPGTIWLAGSNGKVVRSDDGGRTFSVQPTPVEDNLQDIAAWDASRAIAVGNDGVVIVTGDGGATWRSVAAPRSEVANKLLRVRCGADGRAWAVGVMGTILSTDDWGATWRRQAAEVDVAWNDIAFADPLTGWVVGEFGSLMRTTDGGATWLEAEPQSERSLMAVAFRNPRSAVAVGLDGLVLVTGDAGRSWASVDAGTSAHLFEVIWDGSRWVAVGDMGVVVTGSSDGASWRAGKLAPDEMAWHTGLALVGDRLFVSGGSQGFWAGGTWSRCGSGEGG